MSHFKLKKILIIKHGSLGDIISATSVLKDIRDNYLKDEIIINFKLIDVIYITS